ncbi:MAG: thiamine-phosphate kinase [Sphingomonas sp.]|nr:thiamine-phosphate kinase [Sphingomonas sp.]
MTEADFLAALRTLPLHPGAVGLADDAARLGDLVLTTDTLVEGVHFLSSDPAEDVAWKLVAVNLSDLAAKGATPVGVLLNYPLSDDAWDAGFLRGLEEALAAHGCALLGGDTVSLPPGAARVLSATAIGAAGPANPARGRAQPGDLLYVTGTIGDAGAGLAVAQGAAGPEALLAAYRRPVPLIAQGRVLAPLVHAMMDVSDGVLIDAQRMAAASGLAVTIDLARIPLSASYCVYRGDDRAARLAAATAGDDYQLLFAAAPDAPLPVAAQVIGQFVGGTGLSLTEAGVPIAVPDRLGFEHQR